MLTPPGLTPLETAAGFPLGLGRPEPLPGGGVVPAPFAALVDTLEEQSGTGPCVVAFSGGRDSSLVLAAAVRAARRAGCRPPVAATLTYPDLPETGEAEWQETVLTHLGVEDWIRVEVRDDLDLAGALAAEQRLRQGPFFPANAHSLGPLFAYARGGTMLLGLGGDELLTGNRWTRLNHVLARRCRPGPRDALRLAGAALPRALRGRVLDRKGRWDGEPSWLRPRALRALRRLRSRPASEPVRWDRAVQESAAGRGVRLTERTLKRLGNAAGVDVRTPLLEPSFVAALCRAGGARGWGGRTAAMLAIADGALPEAVLAREHKAAFTRAFFGERTRDFARGWSGGGVDPELVDPDVLRRLWVGDEPDFRSALLLQSAWLHDRGADRTTSAERELTWAA